eukprot:3053913-Amphidinium_carterae.1
MVGLHWGGTPSSSADQVIIAVPSHAVSADEGLMVESVLYLPGSPDSSEVGGVCLMILPAFYLVRRLVESMPADASVVCFSQENSGALPSVCELFPLFERPTALASGSLAYLSASDSGDADPDAVGVLRVLTSTGQGEDLDEAYYSAADVAALGDPRSVVVSEARESVAAVFRGRAGGAPKRMSAPKESSRAVPLEIPAKASAPVSQQVFPRSGGSRERALTTTLGKASPGVASKASQPTQPAKKPKTLAELATMMTSAMDNLGHRIGALEQSHLSGGMMGLQPLAPSAAHVGEAGAASLLSPGRVSAQLPQVPPPMLPPGEKAYRQAIKEARSIMPSLLPNGPSEGEMGQRMGRDRASDNTLRLAVEQGGDTAASAVQLAMLETCWVESEVLLACSGSAKRSREIPSAGACCSTNMSSVDWVQI